MISYIELRVMRDALWHKYLYLEQTPLWRIAMVALGAYEIKAASPNALAQARLEEIIDLAYSEIAGREPKNKTFADYLLAWGDSKEEGK